MLSSKTFAAVLTAATELDPYGKRLSSETVGMAYLTLPDIVKEKVSDEMFVYALKQHRLDPSPNKDLPLDLQLLRHVFRCEDGSPNFLWGIKEDLPVRMSNAAVFHGQPNSPYLLGEDLAGKEPRFAPEGVLNLLSGS